MAPHDHEYLCAECYDDLAGRVIRQDTEHFAGPDRAPDRVVVIDAIPPSKKNSQRIRRRAGRPFVTSSGQSKAFERHLRLVARGDSLGSRYVAVRITVDERAGRTRIEAWDLGEPPRRGPKHTRRDVHNCADAVMDALQGIWFDDDRQARAVVCQHGEVG